MKRYDYLVFIRFICLFLMNVFLTFSVRAYAETSEGESDKVVYRKTIPAKTWELAGITDPFTGRLFPAGGYFIRDNWEAFVTFGGLHSDADGVKIDTLQGSVGSLYTITNGSNLAPVLGGEYVFVSYKKNGERRNVNVFHFIPGIRFFIGERNAIDLFGVIGIGKVRGGTFGGEDDEESRLLRAYTVTIGYSFFF